MEPPAAPLIDARNNKTWLKKKSLPDPKYFITSSPSCLFWTIPHKGLATRILNPQPPEVTHSQTASTKRLQVGGAAPCAHGSQPRRELKGMQHYNTAHCMGFCSLKTNRLYLLPVKAALFITWHYWNSYCWRTIESSLFFPSFLIFNLFQGYFQKLQFKEASL